MLDGKGCRYCRLQKEKDDRNWLHVDPNNNRSRPQGVISLWEVIIITINHHGHLSSASLNTTVELCFLRACIRNDIDMTALN